MKKITLLFFAFFFCTSIGARTCQAAPEDAVSGFSITPYYQEINIKKDQEKIPFSLDVKNGTNAPVVFRVSVLDFGTLDETGGVAFLGSMDNLKYSLASWISLQNDTLVLNPGEAGTVKGNIENKDSLSSGGHYGAIYLKNEENSIIDSQKKNVSFDPSLASLLFVRKIGGDIRSLNLKDEDFSHNVFSFSDTVKLRFQNSGNVHVTPRGIVEVVDPFGRSVKKGIINEQSSIVLPETFRIVPVKMTNVALKFFPGKYKMTISYRFDGKDDFAKSERTFFFVPPIFVFAALILLFVLPSGFYFWRKKRVMNKQK